MTRAKLGKSTKGLYHEAVNHFYCSGSMAQLVKKNPGKLVVMG